MSNIEQEWFTPKQAAAYSGFATGTLANWRTDRNRGHDPKAGPDFEKAGARIRYARTAIDAFVKGAEVSTAHEAVAA